MTKLIAVDPVTLLNAAQQLEARSDPVFVAQELRALVAAAQPSSPPALTTQLYRALFTNASHTCGVHKVNRCALCSAIAAYKEAMKQ